MNSDTEVLVCINKRDTPERPSCYHAQSLQLKRQLKKELGSNVQVKSYTCFGLCNQGPVVQIKKQGEETVIPRATFDLIKSKLQG